MVKWDVIDKCQLAFANDFVNQLKPAIVIVFHDSSSFLSFGKLYITEFSNLQYGIVQKAKNENAIINKKSFIIRCLWLFTC
ncbi:hypothetical protein THF1C08_20142 [Vibrio jasicida]|uniref:Uncharacterized protein n=1 Tax=Vibrio jasicida TaxID=766224 RepID=A0AAU9QJB5_9VIBR|nr:hypothetical protein THF1C08_20142 [Vibrio jasicida]CAH1585064.1 hypothetical protein THF1A12_20143 [Vibrio jasicida]